ncbi:TIGR00725 family protein [Candidatus Thorarchaeota archaeon]|nr:MAG: TIGR00725 family protein [Candidatus Thorarchaeota archaeon]
MHIISVIGGSDSGPAAVREAEAIGKEIAKRGGVVACGGLGGVMEAVCRGAKSENGITLGILPTEHREHANEYIDIAIPTGLGYARNFLVAKAGEAVIAIAGSAGTLSEMAIAWFSNRPIIALASSGGWAEKLAGQKIDDRRSDEIYRADTPEEAVKIAFDKIGE